MRRFFTLVCLLCLAIPAGISISGCTRNPAGNYCPVTSGYGMKLTDVASITLQPQTSGISLAYGQTQQIQMPSANTCTGTGASVNSSQYAYGTTNNQLVDISPTGTICAGTWNRNSGGGIADYTVCNKPNPLPTTGGLPYGTAYITASADSVTSNPVKVYVHAQVTSIALVGPQQCQSQTVQAQLDAQACYSNGGQQVLLCKPASITDPAQYACPLPTGVSAVPSCSTAIGTLSFSVGTPSIASINSTTNVITAQMPGTTAITASVAGSGSSAGYFSTCPPQSINIRLANGATTSTITQGVQQNLTTTVLDTKGANITGLQLDYQTTDPIDLNVASGAITPRYPGEASVYAMCQPPDCNPAPIEVVGQNGTGLSISSNPVTVTTPGTASDYVWFASPGKSQYFDSIDLLTGTLSSTVRLPYVPNSVVMDRSGENLYFGSTHELMVFSTASNAIAKQDTSVPGVVLAVSPNNSLVLINDQVRQVFYLYSSAAGGSTTFGGLGAAAQWTPDSKTLYVTDSAALNNPSAGITGHTNTLYVYNVNTGWTTYDLSASGGSQNVAITIPSVGAYLSGSSTVARTWCPSGTVGNAASMIFYPQGDLVPVQTDTLAATTDGQHILGAALLGGGVTLSDIGVTIPTTACTVTTSGSGSTQVQTLSPLNIAHTLNQAQITPPPSLGNVNAQAVNQVVASPASNLAFITYTANSSNTGALLPYYQPVSNSTSTTGTLGTLGYVSLTGSSAISAPLVGAFTPDDAYFFVSTAGDNKIHQISISATKPPVDTKQLSPNLPACTPVVDLGCTLTSPSAGPVPTTAIVVVPRATT